MNPPLPMPAGRRRNAAAAPEASSFGPRLLVSLAALLPMLVTPVAAWANGNGGEKATEHPAKAEGVCRFYRVESRNGDGAGSALEEDAHLRCLRIQGHSNLGKIDLSQWPRLTHLYIDNNDEVTIQNIHKLTSLIYLRMSNNRKIRSENQDAEIDLANLPSLGCLNVSNNENLQSLNLSGLPRLRCLRIRDNKNLKTLDLTSLASLRQLQVRNNAKLTKVKLPDMGPRGRASISHNDCLTTIALPRYTRFLRLHIKDNKVLNTIQFNGSSTHGAAAHDPAPGPMARLARDGPPGPMQAHAP